MLSKEEIERYSRNIVFENIGKRGQKKLKKSSVAIIGIGGIGSSAAIYLACNGIGRIKLIDRDFVELNNIQRQILYDESDVKENKLKVIAAKEKLEKINSNVFYEAIPEDFNSNTAENLVKDVDIILDATDNMETRYLLNEVCVKNKKPFVYGAAIMDYGAVTTIIPGKTPCFKCIFSKVPKAGALPNCESVGVLNTCAGIVGLIEATEAIKYLLNFGELLKSKLLYFKLSSMTFDLIEIKRNKNCDVCVKKKFEFLEKKERISITKLCGGNSFQLILKNGLGTSITEIEKRIRKNPEFKIIKTSPYFLIIEYKERQLLITHLGRILVKNVNSENEAKSIVNRIISL
jgi:adenylyltransferase/sulfurtransferase